MTACLIRSVAELEGLDVAAFHDRPEPRRVLMCLPDYFEVVDVKNPFMEGNVGRVDKVRALAEWEALRRTYDSIGHEVLTIPGAEGLEDMVFAANQVLPGLDANGRHYVLLSRMCHPSRQREVPIYRDWFEHHGYVVLELSEEAGYFEGQGDAIWHPGKQLLWGGAMGSGLPCALTQKFPNVFQCRSSHWRSCTPASTTLTRASACSVVMRRSTFLTHSTRTAARFSRTCSRALSKCARPRRRASSPAMRTRLMARQSFFSGALSTRSRAFAPRAFVPSRSRQTNS